MMNFFEVLEKRAMDAWGSPEFVDWSPSGGMLATIEALKEMMVGEMIRTRLYHLRSDLYTADVLTCLEHPCQWYAEYGRDGEEVVVMVFKKP